MHPLAAGLQESKSHVAVGLNVERSARRGAVFLSYASEAAPAVARIAEALRVSGVEV